MISHIPKKNQARRKLFKESSMYVGVPPAKNIPHENNNNYNLSLHQVNGNGTEISSRRTLSNRFNRHHVLYDDEQEDSSLLTSSLTSSSRSSPAIHGRSIYDHQEVLDLIEYSKALLSTRPSEGRNYSSRRNRNVTVG
jgi:hypothetical protein